MSKIAELLTGTISEVAALIERREISPVELVDAQLARIGALDGRLKSYLLVTAEHARAQAKAAEREIAAGRYRGKLHGVPLGIKDLVATRGIATTCASTILADHVPDADAAIMEKLHAAGAICLGKLNLTEFALYGYHPERDYPRNPWNTDYWAGVSSSGSGVATAASLCFGAIGSDTGGSIRFPSAACGIVGVKPTFGKVSRHGVFPLADTLDHLGPMTRSVADAAILLAAIEGRDERDPTTRSDPRVDYLAAIAQGAHGLRIGIDRTYCSEETDPRQSDATFRACFMLRGRGAEVVDVDLTGITAACAHWLAICAVDTLLFHRRFLPARLADYGPVFRSLIEHGLTVTAEDYARAQTVRQATAARFERVLREVDCILCPAMPSPAMPQREFPPQQVAPPEAVPALLRYSAPTNFSGHPSITVPNGFTSEGLPTAMQFIGRYGDEATIFRAAAAYEAATEWHSRRPAL
ncbi:MAG: amidase [Gammaproteobacteria bacterium]|nr:amidase [Gammaproteobacteria bacterium]